MQINIKRSGDHFNMTAVNETGNELLMDASREIGGEEKGFRPMQLLLTALGGCSTIDIILILKKQKQQIESFDVEVNGDREKIGDYSLFRKIELHFKISGTVDRQKAEKAIELSLEKYCSVAKTLESTAKITHKLTINGI